MGRIESRFRVHDKYQFEVKLDYEMDFSKRIDNYRIEAFFFLPASLGINALSYPKDLFYRDLLSYTRYKTPSMSFRELLDESNALSPLTRLAMYRPSQPVEAASCSAGETAADGRTLAGGSASARGGASGGTAGSAAGAGATPAKHGGGAVPATGAAGGKPPPVVYELKMLGAIVKSAARDDGDFILERLKELPPDGSAGAEKVADIQHVVSEFLAETERFFARFRELRREYLSPRAAPEWREAFDILDEATSVQVERVIFGIGRAIGGKAAAYPALARLLEETRKHIAREVEHRKGAGYPGAPDAPGEERACEAYLHRIGMLKKFCGSILYLAASTDSAPTGMTHLLYGLAAAAAMAFALLVSLATMKLVPAESAVFFLAAVVAYAFKDRIKDALKVSFSRRMAWALPDRRTSLRDQALGGGTVGVCREAMSFIRSSSVPPDVAVCRARPAGILEEEARYEQVFKYEKDITLYPRRVRRGHVRVRAINDILRFSVRHFLYKMDEPVKSLPDFKSGDLEGRLLLSKVYHVNVVLRFSHGTGTGGGATLEKLRLILDRDGIRRIETGRGDILSLE
ncbi:MAG: hypothetical protein N3A38_08990 [Planctomycetota bacterium]|nr:hypothetical protein [Planctomycetota bacterium]